MRRTCGKTFPRPNVTLSDLLPAKNERKKGKQEPKLLSHACHAAAVTSLPLCLVNQVWSLGVIHHANNQKRTVKMQSWRTAHKPIKSRSTRRSRQTTNCGTEEHKTLIHGDSFKSKMESLDDEKAALLAAKRQFPPLQSRIDKQKKLSGASLERDRIETKEASGNPAKMNRGRSGTGSSQR